MKKLLKRAFIAMMLAVGNQASAMDLAKLGQISAHVARGAQKGLNRMPVWQKVAATGAVVGVAVYGANKLYWARNSSNPAVAPLPVQEPLQAEPVQEVVPVLPIIQAADAHAEPERAVQSQILMQPEPVQVVAPIIQAQENKKEAVVSAVSAKSKALVQADSDLEQDLLAIALLESEQKPFAQIVGDCQRALKNSGVVKPVLFEKSRLQNYQDCGYYAAYNGALKLAELKKDRPVLWVPHFNLAGWRDKINALRAKKTTYPTDLHDDEVVHIATLLKLKPNDYSIVQDVRACAQHPEIVTIDVQLLRAKLADDNGAHLFILGTMDAHQDFVRGKETLGGHWICVVATNGTYYVMDSLNLANKKYTDHYAPMLQALDKLLA